jgi:hypothetical protein
LGIAPFTRHDIALRNGIRIERNPEALKEIYWFSFNGLVVLVPAVNKLMSQKYPWVWTPAFEDLWGDVRRSFIALNAKYERSPPVATIDMQLNTLIALN